MSDLLGELTGTGGEEGEEKKSPTVSDLLAASPDIPIPIWEEQPGLSAQQKEWIRNNYEKTSFVQNSANFKTVLGGASDDYNKLMDELGLAVLDRYNGRYGVNKTDIQIPMELFDPLGFKNMYAPADTNAGRSFIFMARPALNLRGTGHSDDDDDATFENGETNIHALPMLNFYLNSEKYAPVMHEIVKNLDLRNDNPVKLMPLITNFAEEFNGLPEISLEFFETSGTIDDRKQAFVRGMETSYGGGGTFTINYFENSRYYVMLTHLVWVLYAGAVSKGIVAPLRQNSIDNRIDYFGSAYFVRLGANMLDVDFIAKLGVACPKSSVQNILDGLSGNGLVKPQIEYQFLHWESNTMEIVAEFNADGGGHELTDEDSVWGGQVRKGDDLHTIVYDGDSVYDRLSTRPYITGTGKLIWINNKE